MGANDEARNTGSNRRYGPVSSLYAQGLARVEGVDALSDDAAFPAIAASALIAGGAVWLVEQYNRKASGIAAVIILLGIVYNRDITARVNELVDAITAPKTGTPSQILVGNSASGSVPRNQYER